MDKLATHNVTLDVIVSKINELIDAYNKLNETSHATAAALAAVPDTYTETQREYMEKVEKDELAIEAVAELWKVAFYDDVTHEFTSPVYCVYCQFRSQSLLDRMLLNPSGLCAGCIEKTKWG